MTVALKSDQKNHSYVSDIISFFLTFIIEINPTEAPKTQVLKYLYANRVPVIL